MKHSVIAGGVLINKKGEVAVVSQYGKSWSLPKGHVDKNEDLVVAAKREIHEETGISKLKLIKKLGIYKRPRIGLHKPDDESEMKTIHMFLFTTDEEKLAPTDPGNPEARWVKKEDVAKLLSHRKDKKFFASIVGQI